MFELLAPCGDIKSFYAAVNCGADAVYLGLADFNARKKAENFNSEALRDYVSYAHFFGVKAYVTLNTILRNEEFKSLIDTVKLAVDAKVDAFIVQDLGVLKTLKLCFPNIVIHASTQIGVHNLPGAAIAEKLGCARVVLSRETTLEDVKAIKQNTNLELEYFVQGALCVCFSGNCYLSSREQDASGNRGLCKQLCRLPYTAQTRDDKQTGFLLSAKDLCLIDKLKTLADAGVTSFKIEGRMRREGYVAEAVSVYRKAVDALEAGTSYRANATDKDKLKKVFSRGEFLGNAYLYGGAPAVVESAYNNHTGVKIGRVEAVKPFKADLFEIVIFSAHRLTKGDGLKFFEDTTEKASLGVGNVKVVGDKKYVVYSKTQVKPGWDVNLITDSVRESQLAENKRTVPIKLCVRAKAGLPLKLTASFACANGRTVDFGIEGEEPLEVARTAPVSEAEIAAQCAKTKDTGFSVVKTEIDTDGVFVAKSALNGLRRSLLEGLKDKIVSYNEMGNAAYTDEKAVEKTLNVISALINEAGKRVSVGDKNNYEAFTPLNDDEVQAEQYASVNGKIKLKYLYTEAAAGSTLLPSGFRTVLCPDDYNAQAIKNCLALLDLEPSETILRLPVIANGKDLQTLDETLKETGIKNLLSENVYGLSYAKAYHVIAGNGHNAVNTPATEALKALGAVAVQPSFEANENFLSALDTVETKNYKLPLMSLAHCPFKTLRRNDCAHCSYEKGLILKRDKRIYSLRRYKLSQCYFELYSD